MDASGGDVPLPFEIDKALKRLRLGSVSPYGVRRQRWKESIDTLEREIRRLRKKAGEGV